MRGKITLGALAVSGWLAALLTDGSVRTVVAVTYALVAVAGVAYALGILREKRTTRRLAAMALAATLSDMIQRRYRRLAGVPFHVELSEDFPGESGDVVEVRLDAEIYRSPNGARRLKVSNYGAQVLGASGRAEVAK